MAIAQLHQQLSLQNRQVLRNHQANPLYHLGHILQKVQLFEKIEKFKSILNVIETKLSSLHFINCKCLYT